MIRVYTAQTVMMAGHIKSVLQAEGIPCVLRNEFSSSARGEIPQSECWPEVWIASDCDAERARQLVAEVTEGPEPTGETWRCRRCREEVEAVFAQCWSCGAERPD